MTTLGKTANRSKKEDAAVLGQIRQKSIEDFFVAGGCRKLPAFQFSVFANRQPPPQQQLLPPPPLLTRQFTGTHDSDLTTSSSDLPLPLLLASNDSMVMTNDNTISNHYSSNDSSSTERVVENFVDTSSSFHRTFYSRNGLYRSYDVVRHCHNTQYASSHCPLKLFRNLSLSPLSRPLALSSWLCAKRLSPSGLVLGDQFSNLGTRVGSSVIRFENQENTNGSVLFVVGGSNGNIRVYDHEECVSRIQHTFQYTPANTSNTSNPAAAAPTTTIDPFITVSTRKDIADIQWSVLKTDEIAVAYKFHHTITIYDLHNPEEPKLTLKTLRECTHGNNLIRYLPVDWCTDKRASINTVPTTTSMQSIAHSQKPSILTNQPPSSKPRSKIPQKLLAGSSNGWIRQWTYPSPSSRTSCDWEIRADPSSSRDVPVVDIQLLVATPGAVLIANQVGIITLYDLYDMKMATFQSSASPKCLRRLNIWNSMQDSYLPPLVTGVSICGSMHYPEYLHVSTSNSRMYMFNLFSESLEIDKFDYVASLTRKRNVRVVD